MSEHERRICEPSGWGFGNYLGRPGLLGGSPGLGDFGIIFKGAEAPPGGRKGHPIPSVRFETNPIRLSGFNSDHKGATQRGRTKAHLTGQLGREWGSGSGLSLGSHPALGTHQLEASVKF